MTEEYEKCKFCKHVCYDEPVITCNHPIGFGPDGECPIYGDEKEEMECFINNFKWSTYRCRELNDKSKRFWPDDSTDYHESKSDRLTAYIMGWFKYDYRNKGNDE